MSAVKFNKKIKTADLENQWKNGSSAKIFHHNNLYYKVILILAKKTDKASKNTFSACFNPQKILNPPVCTYARTYGHGYAKTGFCPCFYKANHKLLWLVLPPRLRLSARRASCVIPDRICYAEALQAGKL